MRFKFSSGDVSGFKCLISLGILYGIMSFLVYTIIYTKHIKPLDVNAPLDRFSEARAIEHVRVLSQEIDGRQEGRPGLKEAARYIRLELEKLSERAGPEIRIEIEETAVSGSFKMLFLGHSISFGYRNHTNIVMRMSSAGSKDTDPSVLINGHFDSPLGSPGAGDCASCVASMLEIARLTVDSSWVPPQPVIFLFNGAEELFLLGSHGFAKTHRWQNTIGAFINVEASGTGGLDLVCQSGPGSWPSLVYAQSAVYPMAHSAAQDIFPVIPGDTDYRIFSEDYGDIPGLDIIFLLGGYFYHTSSDTVDRLLPGSMQARGENLFSLIKAFTSSSKLRNAQERASVSAVTNEPMDDRDRAVFFDYLSWFTVYYSRRVALVLHSLPTVIFLLMPFLSLSQNTGVRSWFRTSYDFMKGMLFHAFGVILAIIVPIIFAILRLLFTSYAMSWFSHPCLAFLMFVPCSLVGLLIPRIVWRRFPLSQDVSVLKTSKEALSDEARFWGAFGLYAFITLVYLVAGLGGGFLTFCLAAFMVPAWILFCLSNKFFGHLSLKSTMSFVIPLIPCLTYSVYFGGFLIQFVIEKMGMMGALPSPYGYFVPDIIVAGVVGFVTGWCVGPLIPVVGYWLARSSVVQFLLHLSVLALALSSQFFPYSTSAPKRLIFQHTFVTADGSSIAESSYDFSVVDSNSLQFIFKYAPEAAKELQISSELSFEKFIHPDRGTWMVLFPVSFLFSGSLKFPDRSDDILKQYRHFPHLSTYREATVSSTGFRKIHLELSLGSLQEVWVSVLNITGPLSSWSFADKQLTDAETADGGPPSYICRLSGSSDENWRFWLEANSSEALRVDVAVLDQNMVDSSRKLKGLFPEWIDVVAYSSFLSSYIF
ncbi:Peptidase M28 [Macleaya cordata]|uniref:Peptidase M28 n=1 Tax=Macleaya cordata TaxID=56857 RepID=A0A200QGB2_MACCD|nr:Peptidase M28 [Macleaya cordata]